MDGALRLCFGALSPAGVRARLSILIFHRVLRERDPLQPHEPTAKEFATKMRWIAAWFNVLPLSEATRRLEAGTLPARALAITFDDGYADNHDVALPVLRNLGLTATFFVATSFLDGGRMFNDTVIESLRRASGPVLDLSDLGLGCHSLAAEPDRRMAIRSLLEQVKYLPGSQREDRVLEIAERCKARLPSDLMMSSSQLASLAAAGMEIGAHTMTHPILRMIPENEARREIARGRERLQEVVGLPVDLFAYPNGRPGQDYGLDHVALVRQIGFRAAVCTTWGTAGKGVDLFQLPRFAPWDQRRTRYALRMARTLRHQPSVLQ